MSRHRHAIPLQLMVMDSRNTPALGARYWTALVAASALGTNTGDFAAHQLGLGHAGGLLPLALLFALILGAEARATVTTQWFYWGAIVTLRTAATNIADLADHDLHLAAPLVLAVLAAALAALLLTDAGAFRRAGPDDVPDTNARYWLTMLVAGVFGTAAGDCLADDVGLGPLTAALFTVPLAGALLALRRATDWRSKAGYWLVVAAIRTAGTNLGDGLAAPEGLGLGLPLATAITATIFVAILAMPAAAWNGMRLRRTAL